MSRELLLPLLLLLLFWSEIVRGVALGRGGQSFGALCCLNDGVLLSCLLSSGWEALWSATMEEFLIGGGGLGGAIISRFMFLEVGAETYFNNVIFTNNYINNNKQCSCEDIYLNFKIKCFCAYLYIHTPY